MIQSLSAHQTRLLRLKSQGLLPTDAGGPETPARVLEENFGVQAQELPAALLSVRVRSAGLTNQQVEQSRQVERSIAWTWCMRGTLHLVAAEDARWLVPLFGPALIAAGRRRLEQLGWDGARVADGLRLFKEALATGGGLTRPEVRRLLEVNGLPFEGQATVHLLYRAAMEGILCAGQDRGKETTYVLFESWLGSPLLLDRQTALAKLARRYLEAYAPASSEDLASWSGLKIGEAREAWQLIEDELVPVEAAGQPAWMLKSRLPWLDETFDSAPAVRLLPRFDTFLLGYASRDLILDPAYSKRIHPGGGIIHQTLLVDGRISGTWKTRKRSARVEVLVEPFEELPRELHPPIEAEVGDLGRFLGQETTLSRL